jgi:uncharacterized protein
MDAGATLAERLTDERYVSLTTFRANGEPVPTPVWFVPQPDGTLLVYTDGASGKVRRLRRSAGCTVAACDARGRVHGDALPAEGVVLTDEVDEVRDRLVRRYGWQARGFLWFARLRRRGRADEAVGLRLTGTAG